MILSLTYFKYSCLISSGICVICLLFNKIENIKNENL